MTSHLYDSKKKAGFHHLAKSFLNRGYNVTFCTVPNTLISIIIEKSNKKVRCLSILYAIIPKIEKKIIKTSWISLFHPLFITPKLNIFFKKTLVNGYSKVFSKSYDIIIFESNNGLFLFDILKTKNPDAKFIYRASDDLELVSGIRELIDHETMILSRFDLISTPSLGITKKFKSKTTMDLNIITQYHGIDTCIYDKDYPNPYDNTKKNFVFVGTGFLDYKFLDLVSNINDKWEFHIIGNLQKLVNGKNITYYGEMPFEKTIPYLKFADVGLQTRSYSEGISTLEKSLKFVQYTYLNLPIIAPKYMCLNESHVFSYEHNIESIKDSIYSALNFDRRTVDRSWVRSWDEIVLELLVHIE